VEQVCCFWLINSQVNTNTDARTLTHSCKLGQHTAYLNDNELHSAAFMPFAGLPPAGSISRYLVINGHGHVHAGNPMHMHAGSAHGTYAYVYVRQSCTEVHTLS